MAYGLPIDIADTTPLPGEDFNLKFFEAIINSTWELGLDNREKLLARITELLDDYLGAIATPSMTASTLVPTTVDEPLVDIPASITVDDIYDQWTAEYIELATWLAGQFTTFRNTYFPDEQAAYTAMEDYLQAAIANPEVGMPQAIADQIWTDDRDRIIKDGARASAEVLAAFATKGFALPPGAAASAVIQIEQQTQDKVAESSRKVATISVDMMKFTVDNLLKLRDTAMKDAVDYVKALASAPEMTSRLTNIGYDAQSKLISSVSQYYNARTQAKELTFKGNSVNTQNEQGASIENLKASLFAMEQTIKAMLSEVQALAQLAVSNFNNAHIQASAGTHSTFSLRQDV